MIVHECAQLSDEWFALRRGKVSASNCHRIITPKLAKLAAGHTSYIAELIGERFDLLYPRVSNRLSPAMAHGVAYETESRNYFELETGLDVRQVGLIVDDTDRICCSPDGLASDDSGLELKNPSPQTHVEWLMEGNVLPPEHAAQIHSSLIATGFKSWWFMSYSPGLPPLLVKVEPDSYTELLRKALDEFHVRYSEVLVRFTNREAAAA